MLRVLRASSGTLDSSDDEADSETDLISFEACLPAGMQVAPQPSQSELDFKSQTAKELKGKHAMYKAVRI